MDKTAVGFRRFGTLSHTKSGNVIITAVASMKEWTQAARVKVDHSTAPYIAVV